MGMRDSEFVGQNLCSLQSANAAPLDFDLSLVLERLLHQLFMLPNLMFLLSKHVETAVTLLIFNAAMVFSTSSSATSLQSFAFRDECVPLIN
jgi:hypothetical protein